MAQFAELVFAYIDELSAASVAGHTDELSTSGRVRERYLERLGQHLLAGRGADVLTAPRPSAPTGRRRRTLTAVLLPAAQVRGALASLGAGTLQVGEDLPGVEDGDGRAAVTCCWSRTSTGRGRRHLLRVLAGRHGGGRAAASVDRAPGRRTTGRRAPSALARPSAHAATRSTPRTTWPSWCSRADPDALADLRAAVLAPLADLPPATRERLAETLRSWLLHQGRRDAVAAELHVHAADGALPDGPAARAVRRPARRPGARCSSWCSRCTGRTSRRRRGARCRFPGAPS